MALVDERHPDLDRGKATRAASPRRRGWLVRRALLAADVAGLLIAFALTEALFGDVAWRQTLGRNAELGLFVAMLPVWVVLAKLYGLYDRDEERAEHRTSDDLGGVFHLTTVGTWLVYATLHVTRLANPDIARVAFFWAISIVSIVGARELARTICRGHASYLQNTIVVGADAVGQSIARKLEQHPEYGLRLVGFVDRPNVELANGWRTLGGIHDLPRLAREHEIGRVIVGFPLEAREHVLDQIARLNHDGVQVDIVPRFFSVIGSRVDINMAGGLPLISLRPCRLSRSSLLLKRALDVSLAALALVVLAPALAAIAIAIKLDSRGPVLFGQERVGSGDRRFRMWKFRTMVADADERKHEVAHLNAHAANGGDGRMFKVPRDPRVTRVGRFLRRYSLDELPQLYNVLVGEMSLVGPRPLIPEEHEHVTAWRRHRLDLKPGMTGLWQVAGRSKLPFEEMVALDYMYVTGWSLGHDLQLLARTIPEVLRGNAAA